ncbi:MAG: type II toxin-antitoxin system PrlF family antitoxin [Propylenella sp.]
MAATLERVSKVTEKGQTTVPKAVRDALGISYGGQIVFRVDGRGVTLRAAEDEGDDPVLEEFLTFLARDMRSRPDRIKALSPSLARRIAALVKISNVSLDEAIEGEVDL